LLLSSSDVPDFPSSSSSENETTGEEENLCDIKEVSSANM
jgi:hypothetical protein